MAPKPAPVVAAPKPEVKAASVDLKGTLMEVVAAKTGYPAEMLELGMELEADLGIDSIKRVEILSALKERVPGLPDLDAGKMATLTTLGAVLEHVGGAAAHTNGATKPATPAPKPAPAVVAAPAAPAASADLKGTLMEVVATKTGYPAEMLELGMELEADLGIDSIKRVEILSALKERVPGLPDLDAGKMATLTTLGAVLNHLEQSPGFF